MKKAFLFILLAMLFTACIMKANNLVVSEATLTNQNTNDNYVMVNFNISWQNSWRNSTNYDGVWLFVKFQRTVTGEWFTAALNPAASTHNTGSQGNNAIIKPAANGKGAFYYRAGDGSGSFESNNVQFRWNYGENNIQDSLKVDIQKISVFGIEMCYVPQGSFYLGSGGNESNHFFTYPTTTTAYQVTSENVINVGDVDGFLQYTNDNQYAGDHSGPIPSAFPKGYNAFWCMKYELSQEQYVDFLNTLSRLSQGQRIATDISGTNITNRYVLTNSTNIQYRNAISCDGVIPAAPLPVTFYCDLNQNGVPNEADDGQNIACNYLNWDDVVAYSIWSGLRPMTELEFEKACRGTASPVADEYAWGNTSITAATGLMNSGYGYEAVSSGNCNYSGSISGPLRVGIFASGSSTRIGSGASYYGIMELSGNLWERCISVGNAEARSYNPILNEQPTYSSSGFRGGGWYINPVDVRVSDRYSAAGINDSRSSTYGFRCCVGE